MSPSLDRLERFFSKKKPATTRTAAELHINDSRPCTPLAQPAALVNTAFPQPSFIRPKTSRMFAREEFSCPPTRSPSESSPSSSLFRPGSSMSATSQCSSSIRRQGSLSSSTCLTMTSSPNQLHRRRGLMSKGLVQLQIPNADDEASRPPSAEVGMNITHSRSGSEVSGPKLMEALSVFPRPRVDTPPASDHDGDVTPKTSSFTHQPPASQPQRHQLTPSPSPKMTAMRDWLAKTLPATDHVTSNRYSETWPARPDSPTKGAWDGFSPSGLETRRKKKTVLKAPNVDDFYRLTDEDIAERRQSRLPSGPPPEILPPPPPVMPLQIRKPAVPASLQTPPSSASHPLKSSAIAALEAARIATKYDLDLLYIINLWPSQEPPEQAQFITPHAKDSLSPVSPNDSDKTPTSTPVPTPAPQSKPSQPRMKGRLWAAYGLQDLKPPFRLSAGVHRKALQAPGWLEFRPTNPKEDEFARGFACSFGAGYLPPSPSTRTAGSEDLLGLGISGGQKNCGIVFAGYRRVRPDSAKDGAKALESGPTELAALYREAQGLVRLLCEANVADRKQKAMAKA